MSDHAIISAAATRLYGHVAAGTQPTGEDAGAASELLNLKLVRRDPATGSYAVEDPAYVAARLAAEFHAEAARQLTRADQAATAFDALSAAYGARTAVGGSGLVEHLTGMETINGRLGHIFAGCAESVDVFQPTRRIPANLARIKSRDLASLGRGVRMRTLYHEDVRAGFGMDEWVADMTAAGAQVRTLDAVFPRMFIIDRRIAVIPGEEPDVARIVHDQGVAQFLTDHLFECHWECARPWGDAVGELFSASIDARQQRILELMASGKTTKEIGTILELKPRRMAELMAELKGLYGAETLFQLACLWRDQQSRL